MSDDTLSILTVLAALAPVIGPIFAGLAVLALAMVGFCASLVALGVSAGRLLAIRRDVRRAERKAREIAPEAPLAAAPAAAPGQGPEH